ncbi:MAG TPA: hypothetical protein VMI56_19935 [Reyranella sp.]|nr:hypothetical protein [Reyranella sp.]
MTTTAAIRRTTIALLWAVALWGSWECRGLYADGAMYLVIVIEKGSFLRPDDKAREYAIAATQIPLVIALKLGITDMRWLSRAYSLGLFAVPTVLYQMALTRAKDDTLLLAAVIAAIALAFFTTSTFIVGEYNTGYALAVAAAVWISTCRRWNMLDGSVLTLFGLAALRSYESFLFFGPLLAAMIVLIAPKIDLRLPRPGTTKETLLFMFVPIAVSVLALADVKPMLVAAAAGLPSLLAYAWLRPAKRGDIATFLGFLAILLFLASAPVAMASVVRIGSRYLVHVTDTSFVTWRHIPLDLMVAASLCLVAWAIAQPTALRGNRPYLAAAPLLVILALSPLAALVAPAYPALTAEHYLARAIAVLIILAIVAVIAVRKIDVVRALPVFSTLETEAAARRCLLFFFAMLLAALPSVVASTITWSAFLDSVRATVRGQQGVIALKNLPPLLGRVYWFEEDAVSYPSLSLVVRASLDDGMIEAPRPLTEGELPKLGNYFWRD